MAFQTGSATGIVDLFDQIVTFVTANGWTLDSKVPDGSGERAHLHNGSVYVNLRAGVNENIWANGSTGYQMGLYLGTGYSGASDWRSQAGGPLGQGQSYTVGSGMALPSGALTGYWFMCARPVTISSR